MSLSRLIILYISIFFGIFGIYVCGRNICQKERERERGPWPDDLALKYSFSQS